MSDNHQYATAVFKDREPVEKDFTEELYKISKYNITTPCKWYDHDKDMKTLSKRHPEFTFVLYGRREGSVQCFLAVFENGNMVYDEQQVEVVQYIPWDVTWFVNQDADLKLLDIE